jgi:hypothetical protein
MSDIVRPVVNVNPITKPATKEKVFDKIWIERIEIFAPPNPELPVRLEIKRRPYLRTETEQEVDTTKYLAPLRIKNLYGLVGAMADVGETGGATALVGLLDAIEALGQMIDSNTVPENLKQFII